MILKILSKGSSRPNISSFQVIENAASGDCLYLSVLDFMRRHKSLFNEIPSDVADLRFKVVEYTFSKNAVGFRSNWDRFADNILYNLHNQLPILLDNAASKDELKKAAYKEYTRKLGNQGTTTELILIAEMFGFNCSVVRNVNDDDFNLFHLYTGNNEGGTPKMYVYFTGSLTSGHFRYLHPMKTNKPNVIEPGQYKIMTDTVDKESDMISITNHLEKVSTPSTTSNSDLIPCPHCEIGSQKSFKGQRGLKIHIGKRHPDLIFEPNDTQTNSSSIGDLLAKLKTGTRLLIRIPKSARKSVADRLSQTIDLVVKRNDMDSWRELFLFAYKALRVPERTEKSLATSIKENSTVLSLPSLPKTSIQSHKTLPLEKRVEAKLADNDIRGAIKVLSSDDTLAPFDDTTYRHLLLKHPAPSRALNIPDLDKCNDSHLIISQKDVKQGIASFSHGSAPGLDGIRPQHIKDLTSFSAGDAGPRLLASITNLCNLMLSGKVEQGICSILYGAALCALNKKSGGIRPIAIGNFFRRITAKVGCFNARNASAKYLGPRQMGVGIRKGAEAVVHATRSWIHSDANRNKILIKIDYCNAFNSTERDSMLMEIKKQTPLLFPFLHQCNSSPTMLYFGDKNLMSQVGAQQGDPAGSLAFSLAIQPIVEEISTDFNSWYLDDGTIGDYEDIVFQNFKVIIERSRSLGLKINPSKCELFFCSGIIDDTVVNKFNEISPGIVTVNRSNLTLLGSPLFDECFGTVGEEKLSSLRLMTNKLKNLDSHSAYFLLKHCFAIPKLTYFLRTCPSWRFPDFLSNFDEEIRISLESILNIQLDSKQWIQATLPISHGGIGIRRAQDISLPSFLASAFGARSLVANILNSTGNEISIHHMDEALNKWQDLNFSCLPLNLELQRNWDLINIKRITDTELKFNTTKDIARFNAILTPESGKWLNALPVPNNGTHLDKNTLRICIGLRLGAKICHPHTCRCGALVTEDGVHGLSCTKNLSKYPRHFDINNILHRALSSIKVPSTLEPPGLSRSDGKRPDGLTLIPWANGRALIWDATVLDTLANSYVKKTSIRAGAAAELGSKTKHKNYAELKASNYIFIPVALESFGPWAKEAKDFINTIGTKLNDLTGTKTSCHYLHQRISLAIQRYNASCVMETVPSTSSLDEIFYILSKRPLAN